jgi:hypothetical protein
MKLDRKKRGPPKGPSCRTNDCTRWFELVRCRGLGRLRRSLGRAQVAGNLVLAHLVDDQFGSLARSAGVEVNRLVHALVLFFVLDVIHGQRHGVLVLLGVDAAQFDQRRANVLRLALGRQIELEVIALAQPLQLFEFFMVPRDQFAMLATQGLDRKSTRLNSSHH